MLRSIEFDEIYIGFTHDLKARIEDHNSGKNAHTKKFKPWKLIVYFAFPEKQKAYEFERYLKTGSGRAFAKRHFLNLT